MKNRLTIVGPIDKKEDLEVQQNPLLKDTYFNSVLLMAKFNISFRNKLLKNGKKAIDELNVSLSNSEYFLLESNDKNKLLDYIKSFKIHGVSKKSLPDWKSIAAVALLLSSLALTTGSCATKKHNHTRGVTCPSFTEVKKANNNSDAKDTFKSGS